jgi:pheromone shutdown protein TraB
MSEVKTEDLPARVANLEAWVETVMRTLSAMQVEPVLVELDEARRAYDDE